MDPLQKNLRLDPRQLEAGRQGWSKGPLGTIRSNLCLSNGAVGLGYQASEDGLLFALLPASLPWRAEPGGQVRRR